MMSWLKKPQWCGQTPGTAHYFVTQRAIIQPRPLLKWAYHDWYARLQADVWSVAEPELLVELGSGVSTLKDLERTRITFRRIGSRFN